MNIYVPCKKINKEKKILAREKNEIMWYVKTKRAHTWYHYHSIHCAPPNTKWDFTNSASSLKNMLVLFFFSPPLASRTRCFSCHPTPLTFHTFTASCIFDVIFVNILWNKAVSFCIFSFPLPFFLCSLHE